MPPIEKSLPGISVARYCITACMFACLAVTTVVAGSPAPKSVSEIEIVYADLNDAWGAKGLIDSGFAASYQGKDGAAWDGIYQEKRKQVSTALANVFTKGLSASDARAVMLMRKSLESYSEDAVATQPKAKCQDAKKSDLDYAALRAALYACFEEIGNNLEFEGKRINRVAAFGLLTQMDDAEKRKALFLAFDPLWQALNGKDQPDSPYRRMIRMAAADGAKKGSAIDDAAGTLGVPPAQIESWLEQILDTWRQVSGHKPIEPWDYRYMTGEADRALAQAVPLQSMESINAAYYRDLGADLKQLGVIYDLAPRPGKAPLAYTDYVIRGRMVNGVWQPTIARVSASYSHGSLGSLNELVHENGHAIHMDALRTRPAFMDLGDALFYEAFADVPSWSTYEPAWQQKYLGKSASEAASLRSLYSGVMLDVAWALFDLRMLRNPAADPNQVWTDITSNYMHIVPHPEWSWWAVRVQLVDAPGYMVNYGLGAVLTADMRQHIRQALGAFDTGDARWYGWISRQLLQSGEDRETAVQLKEFLGRPVSPQALLGELRRLSPEVGKTPAQAELGRATPGCPPRAGFPAG